MSLSLQLPTGSDMERDSEPKSAISSNVQGMTSVFSLEHCTATMYVTVT